MTTEKNRMLAEFEGFEKYEYGEHSLVFYKGIPGYGECDLQDVDLLYSSSYNWLMRVWHKFRELRFEYSEAQNSQYQIHEWHKDFIVAMFRVSSDISKLYNALVAAVEWYNSTVK